MLEPPAILDSCQVLLYAAPDSSVRYSGSPVVFHDGRAVDPAERLAVALNLFEGDFLLCRCTEDWDVLGVSGHASLAEARESAERTYRGISAQWLPFRELTTEELAEVAELRAEAERVRREGLIGGVGEV
jgi:hypothetical protein